MDPDTPPEWERSQGLDDSNQETPRRPRTSRKNSYTAPRTTRSISRFDPYRAPTPAQRPKPASRSVSPSPARPRKRSRSVLSLSERKDEITGYSDDELDKVITDAYDYSATRKPPKVPKDLDLNTDTRIFGTPGFTPSPVTRSTPFPVAGPSNVSKATIPPTNVAQGTTEITPAPFPITVTPPHPWVADAERLLSEIAQKAEETAKEDLFQQHVADIESGSGQLFPDVPRLQSEAPIVIPDSTPPPIPHISLPPPGTTEENTEWSWFADMTKTINALAEQQANIHRLLVHSISQNNVLGSFSASVTHNIEKRIEAIEASTKATEVINKANFSTILELGEQFQTIGDNMTGVEGPDRLVPSPLQAKLDSIEAKIAGLTRQTGPSSIPQGTTDAINTIARKVATIEQKVVTKVAPNPPGPKNTEPPPPKFATKPTLSHQAPITTPPKPTDPWYMETLTNASTERIRFWAAMVSTGLWGTITNGKAEVIDFKKADREGLTAYVTKSANFHFRNGGSQTFVSPPAREVSITTGWTRKFKWEIVNFEGQQIECEQEKTVYPPGIGTKTGIVFVDPSSNPKPTPAPASKGKGKATVTPSPSPHPRIDEPWVAEVGPVQDAGWTIATKKSFAKAAATPAPTKNKYNNVPVNRFMAPPPKQQARRPGGYGKRYTLRIGQRDKPTKGTAMPIQVIVSEINRTYANLNIRANSTEWTQFFNLSIYFTHDSVDAQIEKARATILGVVCKGHTDPNTSFHKAVKWSRVVIRNVPKRRWVADESGVRDEDTGAPHGNFVPVTKGDLEAELRAAHPLLTDTVFMEGPDWTRRPGSTQDDNEATANVSFAIPDHEEKRISELTKRPITLFYTQSLGADPPLPGV